MERKVSRFFFIVAVIISAAMTAFLSVNASADVSENAEKSTTVDGAYEIGSDFAMFIQAEDERFVSPDSEDAWTVTENDGSIGVHALKCNKKVSDVKGAGITVRFAVPRDGDYYFWGRLFYPTQSANSMFYSFDGGTQYIWDLPDEDSSSSACYNSWQYFYMTYRQQGSFTDTEKYGAWTIENGEWRHAPQTVHLTAGIHELKITGREAGMILDELIVTSYDIATYDPNICDGNDSKLETCKFCGTEIHHYVADIYNLKGVTAEKYFTDVLHTTAKLWQCPYELIITQEPQASEESVTDTDSEQGTSANSGEQSHNTEDSETVKAQTTDVGTEKSVPEKKGCSSSLISVSSIVILASVLTSGVMLRKMKAKDRNL